MSDSPFTIFLNSVEQLEILLPMAGIGSPELREWNAAEVSRQLYTQPQSASLRFLSVQKVGLV
jgi:hypothetical protein